MPALSDDREEALAQELAKGGTQAVAYVNAGYSAKNSRVASSACNRLLKKKPEVNDRIKELQVQARDAVKTGEFNGSLEELARMFLQDRMFAQQVGQAGASVSATSGLMKLFGHGQENHKHGGDPDNPIHIKVSRIELVAPAYDNPAD
jgi:hypothetical protein